MIKTITCTLALTHDCTLRCRYCYAGRKYRHSMSRETARRAIDIVLREARDTDKGADISFFGGEPLLEWDLLQWCHSYTLSQANGLIAPPRFAITTNGTLMTPEKLNWMAERDFLIGLSVDGSPDMHNINRCYPDGAGSHSDVAKALLLLNDHPSVRSQVICVVTPSNVQHLSDGVQWLSRHYQGTIGLNVDYWSRWTDEDFEEFSRQYAQVAALVIESYRKGAPIRLRSVDDKINSHIQADNLCQQCKIGEREIAVSVDGNFFPCSRLIGEGDSEEMNFGNVIQGLNRARQQYIISQRGCVTPACKICALRRRCVNSCGCTNFATSGKLNEVSAFLCCTEKLFINTADAIAEELYTEHNPAFMKRFYGTS